ncbi:MAG: hypothetical protein DWH84_06025, partial [Planctomycetota bacterium]
MICFQVPSFGCPAFKLWLVTNCGEFGSTSGGETTSMMLEREVLPQREMPLTERFIRAFSKKEPPGMSRAALPDSSCFLIPDSRPFPHTS